MSNLKNGYLRFFLFQWTYVQVCTQLRNLRFFVCLRKIAKIARSTIFRVLLRFFAVVSLVNDISRKRAANFAKIAKHRKANDFSRSLAIFRNSVITERLSCAKPINLAERFSRFSNCTLVLYHDTKTERFDAFLVSFTQISLSV